MRHLQTVHITACGSGNFLVIAYKELRKLEHAILERIGELSGQTQRELLGSWINIENFYGIEIDPFATEVAILSMWIAKHQMNVEFREKFGIDLPLIPLKEAGQVHQGNATRVDWNSVCANNGTDEIYLISNPPYLGSSVQEEQHKDDFRTFFGTGSYEKNLDYVALWFIKGARYITGSAAQLSFVSTNSVCQGQQVAMLWPQVFNLGLEIGFAHTSFKWENNAKKNAGVTVVVIGLRPRSRDPRYLFVDGIRSEAKQINAYLADANDVIVTKRSRPLAQVLPPMLFGSKAVDKGNLILEESEKIGLVELHPELEPVIRGYVGAEDYIKGTMRYALWFDTQSDYESYAHLPEIEARVERVREMRAESKKKATKLQADTPWRFAEVRYKPTESIIVPSVSSERREYVPMGYLDKNVVISNAANAIYDAQPWVFALLTSRMHMTWMRAAGGRLKKDYRYAATLVYNTFPIPGISGVSREALTEAAFRVLDVREYHSEKTLAELYDPEKMPGDLREAHQELDDLVDRIYKKSGFELDEDRLPYLFRLYEEMTAKEEAK
ncbi:class I SAM-dependent DNA methyltransferase [Nesterenkonia salmonea]|uniref:site-specific DNA-methyltransferase (adenine-specific) n=1 Tax=Nesterenkonia salmonea TaxID=1804987 RepID=A0A5R9B7J2_9MICC|nr:DNA methyltransferase [Nesterenkonia salmonea]TLP93280.1 class I SAM-dependent DNA methyltransferase [Nesterenkonia salmonea]